MSPFIIHRIFLLDRTWRRRTSILHFYDLISSIQDHNRSVVNTGFLAYPLLDGCQLLDSPKYHDLYLRGGYGPRRIILYGQ